MMSLDMKADVNDSSHTLQSCWSSSWDENDGVPRFYGDHSTQTTHDGAIGHGGDRGSLVYSLKTHTSFPLHFGFQTALKMYPISITRNEVDFIRVLFSIDLDSDEEAGICRKLPYLVLPLAIATVDGVDRGILMEQQDCSLKQFLLGKRVKCFSSCFFDAESDTEDSDDDNYAKEDGEYERKYEGPEQENSSLLVNRVFEPLRSCQVVTAITFQLVVALAALNEELPHIVDGIQCTGFTHNDLHLGNILLTLRDGHIALCDFELVAHVSDHAVELPRPSLHRLPPYCRQSPHGLFCRTADTWALALVVISLLTGVDPLFDDNKLMDDFGDGPLLQKYTVPDRIAPVLDWEANIKEHVVRLLLSDDRTGKRLVEAEPLMDLCAKCLVNRPGASPSTAVDLLREPIFTSYIESPRKAENEIKAWIDTMRELSSFTEKD